MLRSIITGTGCYIPPVIKKNADFFTGSFYGGNNQPLTLPSEEVVKKFEQITGIEERRYAPDNLNTSDIAAISAQLAIDDSGIDAETIDQIIVAHNYGDVMKGSTQSDTVPSVASRVKHLLGIRNPACVPYDLLFGCPGWVQGLIQADAFCKAGMAKTCLVIGAETLSRVVDEYDRDGMIFSDGAGASIVEYKEMGDKPGGILSASTRSDCVNEVAYINFGESYHAGSNSDTRYIKMKGRKVYEYAVRYVPEAMKGCLDKSGVPIEALKKIFIHQANEKMDEAMVTAFYNLYGIQQAPEHIMPMSIHWLGNSSVATIPTLYDLVCKEQVTDQRLHPGDVILFASVGAGMNINAICYQCV
ncbi:3-oxoacyl-ACP synthase [Niastella vici]|uniref:3-oxoacyl-ACP synthase n=1 Tax=Niastella vici TaxID=1703345 RepID=A0A1V9FF63_9BACT|nr:3-oxoacyl-ACP synthase III family protein [Niastella vici]OQP56927.1 3-oxoacyl-ACP synthase [Niastella vici]